MPLALMASLADAGLLWGIRAFMDLLQGDSVFTIPEWLAVMVLLTALRLLFLVMKTRSSESFLFDTGANVTNWFLYTLRNLSPRLFHSPEGDARVEAAYDATLVLQGNGSVFFQAVQAVLQLAIFFPVLLYISWPLTLFLFVVIVPVVAFVQRRLHSMGSEEESLQLSRSRFRAELARARRLYRSWSGLSERSAITGNLRSETRSLSSRGLKASVRKNGLSFVMEAISVLSMVLVLAFCALLIGRGWMDATGLVMFCSAVLLCYKPVKECARILPQFRSAVSAYNILMRFGKLPRKGGSFPAGGDTLSIEDAEFGYEASGRHVFNHFSARFQGDTPVLLRGRNGAGKTTLLRLVARLEEWDSGEMVHMEKARSRGIFFMAQDLELPPLPMLQRLLAEGVAPEVQEFMDLANVKKLLAKEGHSGGERAKVALTWALASKAAAILLDEPFAAVALADREPLLRAFLKAAKALDKWVVVASHDALSPETESLFNVMVIDDGCC
ncbi:ATP-binding cassette domain-containing protein [Fibrobacter sp. UBA4309]|uniref:ATP-binding cassette domain-containing protein n=1 Tax=Fibrobacter sp. UBA4309 TaxID=1946537 RepID=UPI0025C56B39|nr:ATP-binding cassette domain-containing protein [Fibrobacter sp. UBA4309]